MDEQPHRAVRCGRQTTTTATITLRIVLNSQLWKVGLPLSPFGRDRREACGSFAKPL